MYSRWLLLTILLTLTTHDAATEPTARPVSLSFVSPTTNADGTPLTDLEGHRLYWGLASRAYTDVVDLGSDTTTTLSALTVGQTYYVAATAYDTSGNESIFSEELSIVAEAAPPPDPTAYRQLVRAGGTSYTDHTGWVWSADRPYTVGGWGHRGGKTYRTTLAIANTEDDPLYQTERYGTFSYVFDLPNGVYDVTLHLAENYHTSVGKRLFDVRIEGTQVLNDYDIFRSVGSYLATSLTIPQVHVQDAQLLIEFLTVKDAAKVSAIEIESSMSP